MLHKSTRCGFPYQGGRLRRFGRDPKRCSDMPPGSASRYAAALGGSSQPLAVAAEPAAGGLIDEGKPHRVDLCSMPIRRPDSPPLGRQAAKRATSQVHVGLSAAVMWTAGMLLSDFMNL